MNDHTAYLFATPSFIEGVGRLVDFGDFMTEYNSFPSDTIADVLAMRSDFAAVGDDLRAALQRLAEEHQLPA